MPVARYVDVVRVNESDIPFNLRRDVSGAAGMKNAKDIAYRYGARDHKPFLPLYVKGPDDRVPMVVAGWGEVEASEIQDLTLAAIDKQQEMIKRTGRAMDFDEMREQARMVRREDFPQMLSDAALERAEYMKAHSRTDPEGHGDK